MHIASDSEHVVRDLGGIDLGIHGQTFDATSTKYFAGPRRLRSGPSVTFVVAANLRGQERGFVLLGRGVGVGVASTRTP